MLVSNTLVFLRDYPVEYNTKLSVLYGFQRGLRSLDSNTPATDDRRQTACQSGLSSQLAVNTDFVYFYRAMLSIRGTSVGFVAAAVSMPMREKTCGVVATCCSCGCTNTC